MYKKQKKQLKSFLNLGNYSDELFSRNSMTTIIRALLEPVINQNAVSLIFTRFKNKEGLEGLIKRLEYCNNVEIVDTTAQGVLIKDDYVELEFIVFTSARYNFVLIWDYSSDSNKNYTNCYFLANSRAVNDVYEIVQSNLTADYREKFYLHKPERRENELLNEALFNVLKKLNTSIEENAFSQNEDFIVDLSDEDSNENKIKEITHEIKNQLSVLDIYTKLIEKQFGKNKNTEILKKTASIITAELNELRNFGELNIKEIILQDVILEAVDIMSEILCEKGNKIAFKTSHKYDISVFADENKLLSVLINIIKNANESSKNDEFLIEIKPDKNSVFIDITNHGEEIKEENKKLLFEKGFTTKQKGWGIGLYNCRQYIKDLRGSLELLDSNKEKTTFRITLPLD